jgi:integrase
MWRRVVPIFTEVAIMARKRGERGDGSIEQLPSGKYRAVVSAGKDPTTGKRIKVSRTFDTSREAREFRDELRKKARKLGGQNLQTVLGLSLADWLGRWLEGLRAEVAAGELATHTLRPYEQHVKNTLVPYLGQVLLPDLRRSTIKAAFGRMMEGDPERELAAVSSKMLAKVRTTLGVALQAAVDEDLLEENPVRGLKRRRRQGKARAGQNAPVERVRYFEEWQALRFLEYARADRLHALWVLWLDSGAREGELFALHWAEIDWEKGSVRIIRSLEEDGPNLELKDPKTEKSRRTIAVSRQSVEALGEHRKRMLVAGLYRPYGPVFCDTRGGFLRKDNVRNRHFRKIIKRANQAAEVEAAENGTAARLLPVLRPYDLRHTCATLLLMKGFPVHVVAERLGHESPAMVLKTYGHVLPGMQKAAAQAMETFLGGTAEGPVRAAERVCPTGGP